MRAALPQRPRGLLMALQTHGVAIGNRGRGLAAVGDHLTLFFAAGVRVRLARAVARFAALLLMLGAGATHQELPFARLEKRCGHFLVALNARFVAGIARRRLLRVRRRRQHGDRQCGHRNRHATEQMLYCCHFTSSGRPRSGRRVGVG